MTWCGQGRYTSQPALMLLAPEDGCCTSSAFGSAVRVMRWRPGERAAPVPRCAARLAQIPDLTAADLTRRTTGRSRTPPASDDAARKARHWAVRASRDTVGQSETRSFSLDPHGVCCLSPPRGGAAGPSVSASDVSPLPFQPTASEEPTPLFCDACRARRCLDQQQRGPPRRSISNDPGLRRRKTKYPTSDSRSGNRCSQGCASPEARSM
jgi:hypothetical protein